MNPRVIEQIFSPFIPTEYKEEYMQFIENIMQEYNNTKCKESWNRYQSIHFVPKDIELQKELKILENKILGMPDDNIQRLLRDVDNGDLARVMQGFSKKANEKIFENMSGKLKNMMVEDIVNLFYVINETYQTDELAMKKCTKKIADILDNLSCSDELLLSDIFALLQ